MTQLNVSEAALRQLLQEVVTEALADQRDLLREVVLEEFALAEAIREGQQTEPVSRDDVFALLGNR